MLELQITVYKFLFSSHLRIHFREETEPEPKHFVVSKTPTVRSPRQNIRTPNKFKEFDVDLVGIRSSAVKRTPEEQTKKKVKVNFLTNLTI